MRAHSLARAPVDAPGTAPGEEGAAFDAFFSAYRPRVAGLALRYVTDPATVDDIVQEAMARAFAAQLHLESGRDPWPWLATVTRHLCHDLHRETLRLTWSERPEPPEGRSEAAVEPEPMALRRAAADDVRRALREVAPRQRRLVVAHHVEGRRCDDLAEAEGVSVDAVKAALARARRALATRLEGWRSWIPGALGPIATRWRVARAAAEGMPLTGPRGALAAALAALLGLGLVPSSPALDSPATGATQGGRAGAPAPASESVAPSAGAGAEEPGRPPHGDAPDQVTGPAAGPTWSPRSPATGGPGGAAVLPAAETAGGEPALDVPSGSLDDVVAPLSGAGGLTDELGDPAAPVLDEVRTIADLLAPDRAQLQDAVSSVVSGVESTAGTDLSETTVPLVP